MLLAREAMPNDRLYAVYVDHGLRPRDRVRADIAAVRAQARHAGARVVVRRVRVARRGVSVEAAARAARYRALAHVARQLGAKAVITGHQRDDVAETMLLALVRGAGTDGLAQLRARRPLARGIALLRPLLGYGKMELLEFMRAAAVPVAQDETNDDLRLRRNAVRALLRELERLVPGSGRSIARSARLLAEDKLVLESLAATAWQRARLNASTNDLSAASLRMLPPGLLRQTIRHAVRRATGSLRDFHFEHCDAIARAVLAGRGGTFHAGRSTVELSAGRLCVIPSAAARSMNAPSTIVVPAGRSIARDSTGRVALQRVPKHSAPAGALILDAAALPSGTVLTLRTPRPGDRCIPSGRRRPVSLVRFLAKARVPKHRRAQTLLLCRDAEIVAALGVRVMAPYVPRGESVLVCTAL